MIEGRLSLPGEVLEGVFVEENFCDGDARRVWRFDMLSLERRLMGDLRSSERSDSLSARGCIWDRVRFDPVQGSLINESSSSSSVNILTSDGGLFSLDSICNRCSNVSSSDMGSGLAGLVVVDLGIE